MLSTEDALAELQRLEAAGIQLLGLDGLRLHADGAVEGPIDLIFDFTMMENAELTSIERFAEARQFVLRNAEAQIRWEINPDR